MQNIHNLEGVCPYCGHSNFMLRTGHWIEPKVLSTNINCESCKVSYQISSLALRCKNHTRSKWELSFSSNLKCTKCSDWTSLCTKYIIELHMSIFSYFQNRPYSNSYCSSKSISKLVEYLSIIQDLGSYIQH